MSWSLACTSASSLRCRAARPPRRCHSLQSGSPTSCDAGGDPGPSPSSPSVPMSRTCARWLIHRGGHRSSLPRTSWPGPAASSSACAQTGTMPSSASDWRLTYCLDARLAEPVFPPNKVMELASLQGGMGSDRARSAADAAGYDHTEGETHVRNGLGYHARHHLLGSAGRLRGSQLPQRPLGPWPHWLHLPPPVDHRGDFAQQICTPLTRSRTTRLDCPS